MNQIKLQTKSGKTLNFTLHAQDRQFERDFANVNLQEAISRAVTLTKENINKHAHLSKTFYNKIHSYDQSHIQIMVNPYYNIQFRIDTITNNIVTVVKYK